MSNSARTCPVDGRTMIETEIQGEPVDQCPHCRGIWCDRGELEAIISKAAPALAKLYLDQPQHKPFTLSDQRMRVVTDDYRGCPAEGAGLEHRERLGVAVDICPLCQGIWLDADELQAIIHLAAERLLALGSSEAIDQAALPIETEPEPQRVVSLEHMKPHRPTPKENFQAILRVGQHHPEQDIIPRKDAFWSKDPYAHPLAKIRHSNESGSLFSELVGMFF